MKKQKATPSKVNTADQAYEMVPIEALRRHPKNPRQGDVGAIVQSIEANGFYGAVVAQRSSGFVLAGNHRLDAEAARGTAEIPCIWVDCDDDRAPDTIGEVGGETPTRTLQFIDERPP